MKISEIKSKASEKLVKCMNNYRKTKLYFFLYEKGVLYFLISFFIPVIIMLSAFKEMEIHPYGERQMLVVDLWHQYFPFFRVVREKLLEDGSFLYSWQNGLGTNFLSLISYYAASPLNWISVFFDDNSVRDALTYILIAKIGFCGAFFSCFLRYTFRRKDFSICIFSTMFALCSYVLGYYWNVMWFDTISLFPLVMLGIVAICREKKWKLFTITLALSLISNYYIGFFTCIFTIFMFAAAIIIYAKNIKDFFVKLWIIIRSSAIGIALGGFMLLPAYYGLKLTYSAENKFPESISWFEKWTDIFANLISYNIPTMKEGLPNFACGMLAVTLFGVFLFSRGIKIREKISSLFMLAFIAISCNMNILNFIWHGFHFTNMIPYRFAFIFSFVLVASAYRAYDVILKNNIRIYQILLMPIFPLVVFGLNCYKDIKGETGKFVMTESIKSSLILCVAFILIFTAAKLFSFKNVKLRNTVISFFIAFIVISECVSNAEEGVLSVGTSDYKSYPSHNRQVQSLLNDVRENDNTPFYRTEMTETYTLNDSALYGYNGISQFSSSANVSVTKLMRSLGIYASEAGNRYCYRIATPVVNSLFGVKYLISKNGKIASGENELECIDAEGEILIYENKYALSLGYMINEDAMKLENKEIDLNPLQYQNKLLRLATGINEDCFIPQPVKLVKYNDMNVTKREYGKYNYTKEKKEASSIYYFDGLEDCYLYGYASSKGLEKVIVKNGNNYIDKNVKIDDYPIVFPMGNAQENEEAELTIMTNSEDESGNYTLMTYAMKCNVFNEAYSRLADEQLEISKFSDTEIIGKINAEKEGIMVLSMPYEKGWSIFVDGKKTKTENVFGALLGVKLESGEHDIEIRYIPEGLKTGSAFSVAALVFFVLFAIIDRRNKRKVLTEQNVNNRQDNTNLIENKDDNVKKITVNTEEAESLEYEEITNSEKEQNEES